MCMYCKFPQAELGQEVQVSLFIGRLGLIGSSGQCGRCVFKQREHFVPWKEALAEVMEHRGKAERASRALF